MCARMKNKANRRGQTFSAAISSSNSSSASNSLSWIQLRSVLFVVASSSPASCSNSSTDRVRHKSPWSRKKRKRGLSCELWRGFFTPDGKLRDGGIKFLKKVRSRGVDPIIREEVWPFLLGVYDLRSSEKERDTIRTQKRREYDKLRRQFRCILNQADERYNLKEFESSDQNGDSGSEGVVVSARDSLSGDEWNTDIEYSDNPLIPLLEGGDSSAMSSTTYVLDTESSDSESYEDVDSDADRAFLLPKHNEDYDPDSLSVDNLNSSLIGTCVNFKSCTSKDLSTWQRIIRLDAIRASPEWIAYSPSQCEISESRAHRAAEAVGLKDYENLEPCQIFHAARLVAILEAYAVYDSEIGYCQGMSDLLSPIITVMPRDHEAFWCFAGFMRKARNNFRVDEVGIRRQLNIVSKIIKCKDSHLYRHLEKLKAEDCFFVYRMVVVLFRREMSYEHTLCLWEVIWADQAAFRAGIGKSTWSRIRQRAPPTDDLLLYAVAASVLQRKKLIIEKYSSMDEIVSECNSMSGQLDVWRLLDDAHGLVVTLRDKIETKEKVVPSLIKEKERSPIGKDKDISSFPKEESQIV